MLFSTGSITVVNANLATGVATAGSTVGLFNGANNVAQGTAAQYALTQSIKTVTFQVLGTWTGTIVLQESVDGVNWYNNGTLLPKAGGAAVASTTANGVWAATVSGAVQVRVTASAAVTGTALITINGVGGY